MGALSRPQAEALLAPVRGGRPLYEELRPAYVSLDPLVTLLRRRRFSGVILAAGGPGEGAVWFTEGRLHGAWLFAPGAAEAVVPPDPLEVLRILWGDSDARVAVHPGSPAAPFALPPASVPNGKATGPADDQPPPAKPAPPPPPRRVAGMRPVANLRPVLRPIHRAQSTGGATPLGDEAPGAPLDPAALAAVPWSRLLPETLARVRRHRGTPLAERLEEIVNEGLAPEASVAGGEVRGVVDARRGTAALRAIAEGLGAVAGAAFAERLLWTVGRDFACEDAVKRTLAASRPGDLG